MATRTVLWLVLLLAFHNSLLAHLLEGATYQQMLDKADLVVIAKPLSTSDTSERSVLPNLQPVTLVIGVNTEFETRAVLKGDKGVKKFLLHHYRLVESGPIMNGPILAAFNPTKPAAYLMFLVKEPGGRYAPASGQVDPAAFSIIKLEAITE